MKSCCDRKSFGKHGKCYVAKLLETRTLAELLSSRQNATVIVEAELRPVLDGLKEPSSSTNDKCFCPRTRSYPSPHGWARDAVYV